MNYRKRRGAESMAFLGVVALLASSLVSCSAGGDRRDDDDASPAVSASASADAGSVPVEQMEPAPGITIALAASATVGPSKQYYDGRQGVSYDVDDDTAPYTVIVEHYEPGGKSASEVLETELGAFEMQGAAEGVVTQSTAQVSGSVEAYRLDWEQTEEVPWSAEDDTEINLKCVGIIFDGQDGYSYAVYVYGDSANEASLVAVNAVIDSIQVSQP